MSIEKVKPSITGEKPANAVTLATTETKAEKTSGTKSTVLFHGALLCFSPSLSGRINTIACPEASGPAPMRPFMVIIP